MTHEIELKLTLAEADARRLGRLDAVRNRVQGRARTRRLVSTYFDSPDQRLRQAGIAIRIRNVGRSRILCVKAGQTTQGGVLVRREWEGRVRSAVPETADITDMDLRIAVEKLVGPDLQPVFTTTMSRTSRDLDLGDGTSAVMDVDIGVVSANGHEEHVCEMELELKTGDPAKLYDVAREIGGSVPLRLSTDTKAARGFRLLAGAPHDPVKAKPLALDPVASVEWCLERVVQGCLDQVLSNEQPVLTNEDPEGVHQMRVGLRRLRSGLTLFKRVIPDEQHTAMNAEIRWITAELGRSRDADVQAEEIIGPVAVCSDDPSEFAPLLEIVATEREAGRVAARKAVASDRFTQLVLGVSSWMAKKEWRNQPVSEDAALLFRPVTELACQLLSQRHKKVARRARVYSELPTLEKHELRKDVKKLRYACEFFRTLYPTKKVKAYTTRLSGLQDVLGYLNDVAVTEEFVGHLIARSDRLGGPDLRFACGTVLGWHRHALAAEEPHIERSVRRFLGAKRFWN